MRESRQVRRLKKRVRSKEPPRRRFDFVGLLRVVSLLVLITAFFAFLGAQFADVGFIPRQYYPFVDHTVELLVTDSDVRVLEDAEESRLAGLAEQRAKGSTSQLVRARVVYERAINYRREGRLGYQPLSPNGRQPTFEERDRSGPEHRVRVKLSTTRFDGRGMIQQVWPYDTQETFSNFAIPIHTEPLPKTLVNRAIPVLGQYISTAFANPQLTAGVLAGGVDGPQLPEPPSVGFFLIPIGVGLLGGLGLALARALSSRSLAAPPKPASER